MRVLTKVFVASIAVAVPSGVSAGQKGHGAPTLTHTAPASSHGSATTHGNPHTATTHGSGHTTTATHGNAPKKGNARTGSGTATSTTSESTTPAGTSSGSATGTSTGNTTATTASNPVAQKISSKPQLNSKVQQMLPSGMTLDSASAGFKNQGQFLAALHVSQNLNIPFADLKAAMTGIPATGTTSSGSTTSGASTTSGSTAGSTSSSATGSTPPATGKMSLGQAIHKLRPSADAPSAAAQATTQASGDLAGASSTSTSPTTSTKKTANR